MPTAALTEGEYVGPGGSTTVRWKVELRDGWVDAGQHPAAVAGPERDIPVGTVWERVWQLELPAGTRLRRLEVRPDRGRRVDPLDFLTRPRGAPVRVLGAEFELSPDGALRRLGPGVATSGRGPARGRSER